MKTNLLKQIFAWSAVACLPLGVAQARVNLYTVGSDGLESFDLSITTGASTSVYTDGLAGGISLSGGPSTPYGAGVCTDIGGTLWLGGTYAYNPPTSFSGLTGLAPAWGAFVGGSANTVNANAAIQAAADIFYKYGSILNASSTTAGMTGTVTDEKAALQLAVWTALYNTSVSAGKETILSSFNVTSGGRFQVLGLGTATWSGSWGSTSVGTVAAETDAQKMLSSVNSSDFYTGSLLVPNPPQQNGGFGPGFTETAQELLTSVTPLPEPTTLISGALLLLPFAGGALRLKKSSKS